MINIPVKNTPAAESPRYIQFRSKIDQNMRPLPPAQECHNDTKYNQNKRTDTGQALSPSGFSVLE